MASHRTQAFSVLKIESPPSPDRKPPTGRQTIPRIPSSRTQGTHPAPPFSISGPLAGGLGLTPTSQPAARQSLVWRTSHGQQRQDTKPLASHPHHYGDKLEGLKAPWGAGPEERSPPPASSFCPSLLSSQLPFPLPPSPHLCTVLVLCPSLALLRPHSSCPHFSVERE